MLFPSASGEGEPRVPSEAIRVKGIAKSFPGAGGELPVLGSVSFRVERGT